MTADEAAELYRQSLQAGEYYSSRLSAPCRSTRELAQAELDDVVRRYRAAILFDDERRREQPIIARRGKPA